MRSLYICIITFARKPHNTLKQFLNTFSKDVQLITDISHISSIFQIRMYTRQRWRKGHTNLISFVYCRDSIIHESRHIFGLELYRRGNTTAVPINEFYAHRSITYASTNLPWHFCKFNYITVQIMQQLSRINTDTWRQRDLQMLDLHKVFNALCILRTVCSAKMYS